MNATVIETGLAIIDLVVYLICQVADNQCRTGRSVACPPLMSFVLRVSRLSSFAFRSSRACAHAPAEMAKVGDTQHT